MKVDEAIFQFAVCRPLGGAQVEIQHVRFLVVIEPEVVGPRIQRLRASRVALRQF